MEGSLSFLSPSRDCSTLVGSNSRRRRSKAISYVNPSSSSLTSHSQQRLWKLALPQALLSAHEDRLPLPLALPTPFPRIVAKNTAAHECLDSILEQDLSRRRAPPSQQELALRRVLLARRECVRHLLTHALLASDLSLDFSACLLLLRDMRRFVDHVMLKAAAMKREPPFSNTAFSYRARVYIDQLEVAKSVKRMKRNGIASPHIGKLIYLVEDYDGVLHKRIEWLKSMHVRGRDIGIVLCRQPCILQRTLEELNSCVNFLQEHGVKKEWLGFIVGRCPSVLTFPLEEIHQRVAFFTEMGIRAQDFGRMSYEFPQILGFYTLDDIRTKVEFMKNFCPEEPLIANALVEKPELIALDIKDGWGPILKFYYYLGVDQCGLRQMFCVKPSVFCLDLADNVAPKIRFLQAIGVRKEAICNTIVTFPAFLTYSLDKKIRALAIFLLEEVGVSEGDLARVFVGGPELLACSLRNKLLVTTNYFLAQGISRKELGSMVADFPLLLKYSMSIIKSKLSYLTQVMDLPLKEIVEFPRFFSYSLELRIEPRHKILVERDLKLRLRYMLACSDVEFQRRINIACNPCDANASEVEPM